MSDVVYIPEQRHFCGPNRYGLWLEATFDVEGTIRGCPCGKTWVAYKDRRDVGYAGVKWRREGRWERWRRSRRHRKVTDT